MEQKSKKAKARAKRRQIKRERERHGKKCQQQDAALNGFVRK